LSFIVSHGIDIVSVKRITDSIRRGGSAFLNRVYTASECRYCKNRARKFEHFAARFAVKEALIKALGNKAHCVALNQIEVKNLPSGKPTLHLKPAVMKKAGLSSKTKIEVSLSHEREFAVASVILIHTG